ncbi:HemK2/MTQ2 family protein methyltransferase [Streptomyces sp. 7N604]|uniref:HemK2/MTQ2 family protein methyltransferase n=1 Tax=Streptomyces sp. 7N604 TaxID=3457415 RepID=UPI003FD5A003
MILLRPPGVYSPQGDSYLLREALISSAIPQGARALDAYTGTGVLALAAARLGAAEVCAVDVSSSAVVAARCNARLNRLRVTVLRGDFSSCTAGRRFDVVTANPPYVPCPAASATGGRRARAWDAGEDGRFHLDRLCAAAPRLLEPNGMLLLVQSGLCRPAVTLRMLCDAGLKASVVARHRQSFGPVLMSRAPWLEEQGLIPAGQREEELVVIRADRVSS